MVTDNSLIDLTIDDLFKKLELYVWEHEKYRNALPKNLGSTNTNLDSHIEAMCYYYGKESVYIRGKIRKMTDDSNLINKVEGMTKGFDEEIEELKPFIINKKTTNNYIPLNIDSMQKL